MKEKIKSYIIVAAVILVSLAVAVLLTNNDNTQCRYVPKLAMQYALEYCEDRGEILEGIYQNGFSGCEWRCI